MARSNWRGIISAGTSLLAVAGSQAAGAQPAAGDSTIASAPVQVAAGQGDDGEVIITGSRLSAFGFSAPTPVTVLGRDRFETRAPGAVAELVNEIPSFRQTNGPTQTQRLPRNGVNNLDLRGLGAARTLMLVDGRRQATNDSNAIPVSLVQRVEVVTGGASAAYGSDAVAGVVNIILDKNIQGIRGTVQYGISEEGDNREPIINLAAGTRFADGRGHVLVGVDYVDNKGVGTLYSRKWGLRQPGLVSFGPLATRGTLPAQGFLPDVTYSAMTAGSVINAGPASLVGTAFGPDGTPFAFDRGTVYSNQMVGGDNFGANGAGNYHLRVPMERVSALGRIGFDVVDGVELFAEGAYTKVNAHNLSSYQQVPTIIVSADNPFIPASIRALNPTGQQLTLGRLLTETGGLHVPGWRETYRGVSGVSAQLGGGWSFDAFYQYSQTKQGFYTQTNFMRSLFLQAAYAVPDGNGNAVCGPDATNPNLTAALRRDLDAFRALNPTAVCVPFNIFGYGSPSDAAWDYISGAGLQSRQTALSTQHVGSVQVNGTPFNTWAGPVSVAFGAEMRRDYYSITADAATVARLWASSLTTPFSGATKVTEGFAELGVPLMKDSAFGTALDLNGAIRRTHYSTSGSVVTWKLGATYSPIEALKLRVTRSRDIRAPDNIELFQAGTVSQVPNFLNPINGTTGLTSTTTQGNKNLKPEVAKTWTLGVVATPGGPLKGFQAAFDYYSIDVRGVIGTNLATDIAQRCAQGIQVFCDQIVFDNSPLGIATILLQPINFNRLKTRGFDIDLSYRTTFGKSRMEIRGLVNHVIELSTTDGSGTIDRAGSLQGNGVPAWTANATITYGVGNFEGMLGARYFSASRYDAALVGPDSAAYDPKLPNSINDNTFPSAVYLDLSLRQDVYQRGNTKVQMFGVVSNLLNKQPPFNSVLVNSGGNPFDLIGRSYRVGVRFSL